MRRFIAGRNFIAGTIGLVVSLSALPAHGVIVAGGDGSQNTTAPALLPEFNNVGRRGNNGSGIYLGSGVVLTANHVGEGTITFGGTPYTLVGGSAQQLVDPNTNNPTDLVLFRINGDPGLDPLNIADSTPVVGTSGTMVGNGRNREAAKTFWDVTGGVWKEQGSVGAEASGYKWNNAIDGVIRWGTNTTENASLIGAPAGPTVDIDSGEGDVRSLLTDFDEVTDEGQVAGGDSGGAYFAADGTLLGMMHARGTFTNQPAFTAVFGNVSYIADLSYYKSQIVTYIPEPTSALLLAGAGAFAALRRVRRHR